MFKTTTTQKKKQKWWHKFLIPTLWKPRQMGLSEFEAIQGCKVGPSLPLKKEEKLDLLLKIFM